VNHDSGKFGKGDINEPPKKLYSNLIIEKTQIKGRNVFTLSPKVDVKSKLRQAFASSPGV
jgi:hypothetical protein